MLTIPVFDIADEDLGRYGSDYYGWTDNINFIKTTLLGMPIVSANNVQLKKDNSVNVLNKSFKADIKTLSVNNTFFEKYNLPVNYQVQFNSLRSGPFGNTDPLLSKLFGNKNLSDVFNTIEDDDNEIPMDDFSDYLQELFAQENSNNANKNKVQIPGELQEPFSSFIMSNVNQIDSSIDADDDFWERPYEALNPLNMTTMPIYVAPVHPLTNIKSIKNPKVIKHTPVYEFPSHELPNKYNEVDRDSYLQKNNIIPASYQSKRFDYLHV